MSLQTPTMTDKQAIQELLDDWAMATATKDIDRVCASRSDDVVLFDAIPPYRVDGIDAYRACWSSCFPHLPESMHSEWRDVQIMVSGDLACAHGLFRTTVPDQPEHPCGQSWLRVTTVFRRTDGRWLAVHDHTSLPFQPLTGMVSNITDPDNPTPLDLSGCGA